MLVRNPHFSCLRAHSPTYLLSAYLDLQLLLIDLALIQVNQYIAKAFIWIYHISVRMSS